MILLDTSGVLSALDGSQAKHSLCVEALDSCRAPLLLSPFVLAELDYLLATRVGIDEELRFLDEVASGAYQLEPFSAVDLAAARQIVERYRDLELGLADASVAVLAERHGTVDVLTLDERHFRAMRTPSGKKFRILPADSRPKPRRGRR